MLSIKQPRCSRNTLSNLQFQPPALNENDRTPHPRRRFRPRPAPFGFKLAGRRKISGSLRGLLADVFALYVKTRNFHWHMAGPHFRDYHLLLDDHGDQIFAMTDVGVS
jgi:starvation-inducible DNA-binding protein